MIRTEKLEFPGSSGAQLAARLDWPVGEPIGFGLFAHCFTCSKDLAAAGRIGRELARLGIALLRFDFTGLGHSGGEFASTNFSSNVDDLVAAADHLRERHEAPLLLVGHSLGGAAVLAAAERIPEVRAVATIGAPAEPVHVKKLLASAEAELADRDEVEIEIGARRFPIRRQLLEDLEEQHLEPRIRELGRALLVMHAPLDEIVGIDNATRIFVAAKHPKSFVSLDSANHLLSRREDAEYAARVLHAWASRFLPVRDEERPALAAGEVLVHDNGVGRYGQNAFSGRHVLLADEPRKVGGEDSGPGPYDLLLASLGACTNMTLQMYAARKEWPLEHVAVRLRHEKIHAKDCEHCETTTGRIDRIERRLEIQGPLDDAQRQRLLEIADRCPVHRTLHGEVDVLTELVADAEA